MTVANISVEVISVRAGTFTARKIVMEKTAWDGVTTVAVGTVTRYYAGGIGVVKEVEEIPSENRTITEELTEYSYQE